MTITADKVRRNSWTENLADDWIGTDDSGNVIVRGNEATVRRNLDATSFFNQADLDAAAVAQDPATDPGSPTAMAFAKIAADVDPKLMKDYEPPEPDPEPDPEPAPEPAKAGSRKRKLSAKK